MKNIGRKIGKIAAVGGSMCITGYLSALGFTHLVSNSEYISKSSHSITKPDGIFASITYKRWDEGNRESVRQGRFFSSRYLTDGSPYGEHDGLVDDLTIRRFGTTRDLLREEDYKEYKEEFDKADKLLAETRERFKEYFE